MQLPSFISGKSELYLIGSLSLICACYIVTTWNQFQSLSFFDVYMFFTFNENFFEGKRNGNRKGNSSSKTL